MIGIVAVSHSARLGEAALELALQMVPGGGVQVRVAAGAGTDADGTPILGTDAAAVATAIDELAAECDGVLVLMDLGSAVMSAEMALEFRMSEVPVRLVPAPFVEGLLAAVVAAAAGGDLDAVAEEASTALAAKTGQIGGPEPGPHSDRDAQPGSSSERSESKRGEDAFDQGEAHRMTRVVTVRNPLGIHARPAALIAEASAGADVRLRRLPDGPEAPAASLSKLLVLGARQGDDLELSASGDGAEQALTRLAALFHDGFDEGTDPVTPRRQPEPTDERVAIAAGAVLRGRGVSAGAAAASSTEAAVTSTPSSKPMLSTTM